MLTVFGFSRETEPIRWTEREGGREIYAEPREIVGSVPDRHNKANIAMEASQLNFLVNIKVMFTPYYRLLSVH